MKYLRTKRDNKMERNNIPFKIQMRLISSESHVISGIKLKVKASYVSQKTGLFGSIVNNVIS